LAAGLDKNGVAISFWPSLGFGFVEVGTVTAHPQPGNPQPRLFRLPEERALINRMGFNNQGSANLAVRLRKLRESGNWPEIPVGVNVGKSKVTPIEEATDDYVTSIERLVGLADYFTINVSSPNTPGLRQLQTKAHLEQLLPAALSAAQGIPVFLKLAPDLTDEAIQEAVDLAIAAGISAIIATNTTVRRDLLKTDPDEAGGMSGAPLWPLARDRILAVLKASDTRIPVIGVGGIRSAEQALELLDAGCVAIQLYSALVFDGPGLPSRLSQGIRMHS
jgi:dihydroorotate dehydrogenase